MPGGNADAVELRVLENVANDHRRGRKQAEQLVQNLFDGRETFHMRGGDRTVAGDLLHFRQHARFPLRGLRNQIERPGEREGRGVVSGHQEGDDVVDDVFVRHALAGAGIRSARHPREQVLAADAHPFGAP